MTIRIVDEDGEPYNFMFAAYQLVKASNPAFLRQALINHSRRTGHEHDYTVEEAKEVYEAAKQADRNNLKS